MKKERKTVDEIVECSTDNVPPDEQSSSPRSVKDEQSSSPRSVKDEQSSSPRSVKDNEILDYNELSKDNWLISYHPICKSCYNVYKTQCKDIETYLGIKKEGDSLDLKEIHSKIFKIIKQPKYNIKYIYKLEHIIQLLSDCITSRLFHHNACYTPPSDDALINLNVVKSNDDHYGFLKDLSIEFKFIYRHYINAIDYYSDENNTTYENIFIKYKPNVLDIVRNIIKNYGDAKDKQNIDTIFYTPSKKQLKCLGSPVRNTRKAQQSRVSESYLI